MKRPSRVVAGFGIAIAAGFAANRVRKAVAPSLPPWAVAIVGALAYAVTEQVLLAVIAEPESS